MKTKAIIEYMKEIVDFLDGNGIVVTDWELVEQSLLECGDFRVLQGIVNDEIKDEN